MIGDSDYLYKPGSGLEVPGIEAVLEYGDSSAYRQGGIPGALRINDRSKPDQVHVSELSGLNDDPDVGDSRTERAGHWGERAGILMPRGRTVGVTGQVRAGNVGRMRDLWRRTRAQFGREEQDLIIHPPGEALHYVNQAWSASTTSWSISGSVGGVLSGFGTFTDGLLTGINITSTYASPAAGNFQILPVSLTPLMPAWRGEDIWITAVVRAHAAAATLTSIKLGIFFLYYDPLNVGAITASIIPLTGTAVINSPTTGTYYELSGRLSPSTAALPFANYVGPVVIANNPATAGAYTLRAARIAMVLLDSDQPSPSGYMDGSLPGFEWEGAAGQSYSYGPCYATNQFSDPDCVATTATWVNDSTSGATVDVAGTAVYGWPESGRLANSRAIHNPSTTSRTLAVRYPATLADPGRFVVASGRRYRVHLRLLVTESFSAGTVSVVWTDIAGSVLSTTAVDTFDPVAPAGVAQDVDIDGIVTAPAYAVRAYLRLASSFASVVTNNRLNLLIAEPRFVDVSEYDPGADAAIDGTQEAATGLTTYSLLRSGGGVEEIPSGARRRIPRPFLLRGVRSLWDGKAPESQRNLQARRDFTMSLRASDPRIYVREERHIALRASGASALVSSQMSAFRAALASSWTTVGEDSFIGTTIGNPLGTRTAPLGGSWASSGDTTDFIFGENFTGALTDLSGLIKRATSASETVGRFAILGSTVYSDVDVSGRFGLLVPDGTNVIRQALVARYVDNSNHLRLVMPDDGTGKAYIEKVIAGTPTRLATATVGVDLFVPSVVRKLWRMRVIVYSSGRVIGQVLTDGGVLVAQLDATDSALATGGTLDDGKAGFWDKTSGDAQSRRYGEFMVKSPALGSNVPAPTNFTYEGASFDPAVVWKASELGGAVPRDGVVLGPSEDFPPSSGFLSSSSLARMYYSAGAITYTTPQVTVTGDVIFSGGGSPSDYDYDIFSDSLIGGAWQYNYLGALLKRVNSTTWLEVRYSSANNAQMSLTSTSPAPPYSLELWCSHDATGALATTKLAAWDVPSNVIIDGVIKRLRAYMDSAGVVYVELWEEEPNLSDNGLIERNSFTLAAGLAAVIGPTVAGRSGAMVRLAQWDDGTHIGVGVASMESNYGSPYVSSFEALDYSTGLLLLNCPVIGDVDDVPLSLELRGELDTPTLTVINLDTGESAALRLSGVFLEADPVTIDMDAGTIRSASGADYFSRRLSGSRFFSLAPGQNVIAVQAAGWDTAAPAHVIATWRDALR